MKRAMDDDLTIGVGYSEVGAHDAIDSLIAVAASTHAAISSLVAAARNEAREEKSSMGDSKSDHVQVQDLEKDNLKSSSSDDLDDPEDYDNNLDFLDVPDDDDDDDVDFCRC